VAGQGRGRPAKGGLIRIAGEILVSGIAARERRHRIVVEDESLAPCNTVEVDDDIGTLSREAFPS
jgi:hypothetical protein